MSRSTYDAIVVGARCAGAPTAMLLARAGARVLLVDRARFPSDTISGHVIKPAGVAALQRWGLLDSVLGSGCPPITSVRVAIANRELPPPPGAPESLPFLAPRRTVLDLLLVEAAAAAGVDVHDATSVRGVLYQDDQVVGIHARSRSSRLLRARAPIVIGADGKQSHIAREVGAGYVHSQAPVSIAYYSYWSGVKSCDGIQLHFAPGRLVGMVPTNAGQVLAFVQCRQVERHVFQTDVTGNYVAALCAVPAVAEALDGACFEGPLRGMLDLPTFFRQSFGPGWALAGDAAHHKDPLIARGMSDAFSDAELLAQAVGAGLGGETNLLPALAQYQLAREARSGAVSALNHHLAELPSSMGEMERRLTALLEAEAAAERVAAG